MLAQYNTNKVCEIKIHHATQLDKLIRRARKIKNQGGARLCVQTARSHSNAKRVIDVLVAKDSVESTCIEVRWLPNSHQFADFLTKPFQASSRLQAFLRTGILSHVPTWQQEQEERHRLTLRRGHRQRAKERKEAQKGQLMVASIPV